MIGWTLEIPSIGVVFEVDRLRRDRHELIGELIVRCTLPGAKTVNNTLVTGDFNFSSVRARQDRAKLLAQRAGTNGHIDWFGYLEDFCQGVLMREREGEPPQDIWDIPLPPKQDDFAIDGLAFPRSHPSILFGDGGSAKSYVALYLAGKLALQGVPVALFDWELSGEEHRERFQFLFSPQKPPLTYVRCDSPLSQSVERVARIIRERNIRYAFFDSIAFACDGKPEDADVTNRYFRAIRQTGIGSLHIAHVNRSETSDQKPFGSIFWHNGARSTWYVKAAEPDPDGTLRLGFFNRKSNLGPIRAPASFQVTFGRDRTVFKRAEVADDPELALKMTIRQRMYALLRHGSMAIDAIAEELDANPDTVARTARRCRDAFVLLDGGRVGLKAVGL